MKDFRFTRRELLAGGGVVALAPSPLNAATAPAGQFAPTWESLAAHYRCPDWFRDAKFGIWAHWGAQCQPERGDWYARFMYFPGKPQWGNAQHELHIQHYGDPAQFGFKDVINEWKAEKWDPEKLVALY